MVIRSALGALGAVAMLGALGMALPEGGASKAPAITRDPPFGSLTRTDFKSTTADGTPNPSETAQILKLAAVTPSEIQPKLGADREPDATVIKAAASTDPSLGATEPLAVTGAGPAASPAVAKLAPPQVASAATAPDKPTKIAMVEEPQPSPVAPEPPREQKTRPGIDINTASADDLDHIPGAGRIGRTIVRHRPYRKIEDLVDKRVLRMGAFQRIQSRIKVD